MEIIPSMKKRDKLIHEGFMYTADKQSSIDPGVVHWRCELFRKHFRCGARLTTKDGKVTRKGGEHMHEPSLDRIQAAKVMLDIKKKAEEEGGLTESVKEYIRNVKATLPSDVAAHLPVFKSIIRTLQREKVRRERGIGVTRFSIMARSLSKECDSDPESTGEGMEKSYPNIEWPSEESKLEQTLEGIREDQAQDKQPMFRWQRSIHNRRKRLALKQAYRQRYQSSLMDRERNLQKGCYSGLPEHTQNCSESTPRLQISSVSACGFQPSPAVSMEVSSTIQPFIEQPCNSQATNAQCHWMPGQRTATCTSAMLDNSAVKQEKNIEDWYVEEEPADDVGGREEQPTVIQSQVYEIRILTFTGSDLAQYRQKTKRERYLIARSKFSDNVLGQWVIEGHGVNQVMQLIHYESLNVMLKVRLEMQMDDTWVEEFQALEDSARAVENFILVPTPDCTVVSKFSPSLHAVYELQTMPEQKEPLGLGEGASLVGRFATLYGTSKTEFRLIRYPDASAAFMGAHQSKHELPTGCVTRLLVPLPTSSLH